MRDRRNHIQNMTAKNKVRYHMETIVKFMRRVDLDYIDVDVGFVEVYNFKIERKQDGIQARKQI